MSSSLAVPVEWVFDELPPSGARRGGDPSEHAFRRDLESLVREVVQNANDQAIAWPAVTFRLVELRDAGLEAYLRSIRWETLLPHLEGAARAKGGTMLADALAQLDRDRRILVLNVEDRGTVGLSGGESEGESHFRALCKDTLYSHKASEGAGGSYGLGKSVLWTFSGLSTVLFNSELMETLPGQESPRLIGRAELPSHSTSGGAWFSGSGWFGRRVEVEGRGARAESVWSGRARELSGDLRLERPPDQTGTTIQIVGYRDPTREDDAPEATAKAIADAAVRFFWPAMVTGHRKLRVSVASGEGVSEEVSAVSRPEVEPFVRCLEGAAVPSASLESPGDVVVRTIPIEIPARRDGTPKMEGEASLVVRLASVGERNHRWVNRVAQFRGPGMVVRYWDRRGLMLGMRPFHAVLVAGLAHSPTPLEPSAADLATERFLRAAEPPGHDEWRPTPALRQQYRRGWGTSLERFHRRVSDELKQLLAPRVSQGRKGPDRLQRRFPIGRRGGAGSAPSAFHFTRLEASFDGSRWTFSCVVEPAVRSKPWRARVRLQEAGADGAALDPVPIEALTLDDTDGTTVQLEQGAAVMSAPGSVRSIAFRGHSAPSRADRPPAELIVEVTGLLEPT